MSCTTYTAYRNGLTPEDLMHHARGTYQRAILLGTARLSGAQLKGKAARYKAHYQESTHNLLDRLKAAGVPVSEVRDKGRRVLVLG